MAFQSRPALDSEQIAAPAQANPSQLASLACAGREAEERLMEKIDNAERLLDSVVLSVGPEASLGIASPQLTVVIPAYNELATLSEIVERVCRLPISKQVIVVDDGSLDGTQQLIRDLADRLPIEPIFHSINQGKGAAIQTGFAAARGEIVIVQDADLEYEPEQIMQVIAPIQAGQAEVVYGSRYLASDNHHDSWIHRLGNRFLTGLSNLASGQKLTDMETCYKAFRRELLQSIHIEQRRFGFEPEITAKLARRGVSIQEVPIRYQPRSWDEGKKIGVRDLFNALWCIVRYRFG
ncbi:MAG: glycosyltransferase family 2 protein [Pirellula sp.]|nr:glycosyltransferase family 2 protein [Pirellula sp.]